MFNQRNRVVIPESKAEVGWGFIYPDVSLQLKLHRETIWELRVTHLHFRLVPLAVYCTLAHAMAWSSDTRTGLDLDKTKPDGGIQELQPLQVAVQAMSPDQTQVIRNPSETGTMWASGPQHQHSFILKMHSFLFLQICFYYTALHQVFLSSETRVLLCPRETWHQACLDDALNYMVQFQVVL